MDCSTSGFPIPHHLPEFAQVHVHWIGDAIQSSHTLLPYSPSAFNLSQCQGLFQWIDFSHQVDKVLELQHQTFQRVFRVDFFKIDWFDLLAFQGTLKNLFQHHSSKAWILQRSFPYMTTGKTIALTRRTSVGKVMSLLSNMLSRLVITFLPRSKRLSISWLQSPSAVILEPLKVKSATVSTVSPCISQEVMGPDAMILVFWMLSFKPTFSLSFIYTHVVLSPSVTHKEIYPCSYR